jgi:hypothetical protein
VENDFRELQFKSKFVNCHALLFQKTTQRETNIDLFLSLTRATEDKEKFYVSENYIIQKQFRFFALFVRRFFFGSVLKFFIWVLSLDIVVKRFKTNEMACRQISCWNIIWTINTR